MKNETWRNRLAAAIAATVAAVGLVPGRLHGWKAAGLPMATAVVKAVAQP